MTKSNVPLTYSVRVTDRPSNIPYTAAELGLGRNSRFKLKKDLSDLAIGVEVNLRVHPARYKVAQYLWGGSLDIWKFIWFGLDQDDDDAKAWFIDGEAEYIPAISSSGSIGPASIKIAISAADMMVAGPDLKPYGGKTDVLIKIPPN